MSLLNQYWDMVITGVKELAENIDLESVAKLVNAIGALPRRGVHQRALDAYIKSIENSDDTPDEKYIKISRAKKHCKELDNQAAIGEIALQAAKEGTDFSQTSKVGEEWLSRYMDAAKFVYNEKTQLLWGNILAGEFESPGSAPPSIIRILSELTQKYAEHFSTLCSLQLWIFYDDGKNITAAAEQPFIDLTRRSTYLKTLGLSFSVLQEIERLGLINLSVGTELVNCSDNKKYPKIHLVSGDKVLTVLEYQNNSFPIGRITLTNAGEYISRFVARKYNPEHMLAVKNYLERNGAKCSEQPIIEFKKVSVESGFMFEYTRLQTQQQTQAPTKTTET